MRKYWSDGNELKYGSGEEQFSFVFLVRVGSVDVLFLSCEAVHDAGDDAAERDHGEGQVLVQSELLFLAKILPTFGNILWVCFSSQF